MLCLTNAEADAVPVFLRQCTEAAGLIPHPTKTRLVNATERIRRSSIVLNPCGATFLLSVSDAAPMVVT